MQNKCLAVFPISRQTSYYYGASVLRYVAIFGGYSYLSTWLHFELIKNGVTNNNF